MAIFGRQLRLGERFDTSHGVAQFQSDSTPPPALDLDDVLKLVPGEVVGPFIAALGFPVTRFLGLRWPVFVFLLCLLACVVLRAKASKPESAGRGLDGVNWWVVGASAIAFFLWAHAVTADGPVIQRSWFDGIPDSFPVSSVWGFIAVIYGLVASAVVGRKSAKG